MFWPVKVMVAKCLDCDSWNCAKCNFKC